MFGDVRGGPGMSGDVQKKESFHNIAYFTYIRLHMSIFTACVLKEYGQIVK